MHSLSNIAPRAVLLMTLVVTGCAQSSQQNDASATPTCSGGASLSLFDTLLGTSTTTSTATGASTATAAGSQVTFYGDLLPILNSSATGSDYKCTVCHAQYATPDGLNSIANINDAITSMQSGSMPRTGDTVPPAKIQLFRVWQVQGFAPGVPGQGPSAAAAAVTSGGTTGGAPGTVGCGS